MSNAPPMSSTVPTLQPMEAAASSGSRAGVQELHAQLRAQLNALGPAASAAQTLAGLLPQISRYYQQIDEERRGVVRSMQLLAEEARSFSAGLTGADPGQLQAILDHIKDVVITVTADGAICLFNPTGEQIFGYSQTEIIGQSIAQLLPGLTVQGSVERGLQAIATKGGGGRDIEARELSALRKDGQAFSAEVVASRVRIDRRDVYVICLRDMSERQTVERALRDSEARYRTLVESAPEVIVVLDAVTGCCTDANDNALRFFETNRQEIGSLALPELTARCLEAGGAQSEPLVFEWSHRNARSEETLTEVRLMALPGSDRLLRASITDISARKRSETITAGERNVFQRIAADAPLVEVLECIVALTESVCGEYVASISKLGADGQAFAEVIGPKMPARLRAVEERTPIDMRNGSSAAAVYLGRAVLVAEVSKSPYWQRRRDLIESSGFGAAWSVPITAAGGRVLGALTVYRRRVGAPPKQDLEHIQHAARLAGIAIERRQAEEALRASEAKFRGLYESVLEGVYQCAPDGQILAVNPAFVKMLGYATAEEIYALPGVSMLYWSPAERAAFERRLDVEGEIHNAETQLRRRDGQQVVVLESARVLRDEAQQVVAYEGTVADITARKRAEQAVFAEKERAQVTLQSIGDGVITTDSEGRIDYLNPVAEQLSGWSSLDARGQQINKVLRLLDETSHEELENPLLRCLRENKVVAFAEQSVLVNRLGQEIAIQDSAAPIRDRNGRTVGAVVVFRDVTKERRLKRALSYQASHDALTGLINRREFDNKLQLAVQSAREGEGPHALLYVDLDQFKVVNDTCGHSAGDRLLRDVTGILRQHVRAADTISRLGGDEFGVLVQHCSAEQAARIADNIRQAVRDYRFSWEQNSTSIGASIGVVEITSDSESVASLLSAADIACYAAKDAGRNRVHLYASGDVSGRHREMYWVSRVTRAVDENRLELYQQPIVATQADASAMPSFCELLVRLHGDNGELILPGEFIPAAERYNIVSAIDRWVVQRAIELLQACRAGDGRPEFLFALNLSGTSLSERSFLDFVVNLIDSARVGDGLCFEITETAVITNMSQAVFFMDELKKRGCRFALDDFGSGLSSFHYLKTLPVDYLKIDGQFIGNINTDPVDRSMIEAICKVARALGILTIAERVETAEVFHELPSLGVDFAQGYFIARPKSISSLLPVDTVHSSPQ